MSFAHLPSEILFEVFSFFEGNVLEKQRIISKQWNSIIQKSELLWKDVYLNTFNFDANLYENKYKEGYIDQFNRFKRAEIEVIVKKSDQSTLYSIDPSKEKYILEEKSLPKNQDQLTCSPNGLFLASSMSNYDPLIHIYTLHPTKKENFGNPIIKIKNKFWAFYYYWSPDSNVLTWMGNYQNTIGLCMLNVKEAILNYCKSKKEEITTYNYLDFLESGNCIELTDFTPLLLGNPFYYTFNNSNSFCYHKSNKELGVFDCNNYQKIDIKLNDPFSIFCSPVHLNNGLIIVCVKNIKKNLYDVIMINSKGETIKVITSQKYDSYAPVITMMISKDEKTLAVSSASPYGVDLMLIDMKTLEYKKFDRIAVEDCFFLFGRHKDENILMIRTANCWLCYGMNESFTMGSKVSSLSEEFYSKFKNNSFQLSLISLISIYIVLNFPRKIMFVLLDQKKRDIIFTFLKLKKTQKRS